MEKRDVEVLRRHLENLDKNIGYLDEYKKMDGALQNINFPYAFSAVYRSLKEIREILKILID
jgi:hypothetical protein